MKHATGSLLLLCPLFLCGQNCPLEPPDLAPAGMVNAKHVCVCTVDSSHCAWAWTSGDRPANGTPAPASLDSGLLSIIANPRPPSPDEQANANYNGPLSRRCAAQASLFGGNIA